ncbi:MAG: thioredoxin fold domain-containing protein [Gammaproteobacteria bacterium]|nr:thioredoxin fold domain-containing protein [Gammaproteobacteria bacterium]
MKILYPSRLFLLIMLLSFSLFSAESQEKLSEGMVNPGYHEKPSWFKESFLDIREDIEEATAENKRVLLYFYQDGCPYCGKLLRDNFADREIAAYSQEKFDVIAINMWGDREVINVNGDTVSEKEFSKNLKVQFTPTMVYLDEAGKKLLRINGYYTPDRFLTALKYIGEKKEKSLSIRDYFKQLKPAKASGKLHAQHNTLANDLTNTSRPLIVSFEQKTCKDCDELHGDILNRKNVKKSLSNFEFVALDMWSNDEITVPDGRRLKIVDWAQELGIQYSPSKVFFIDNREVFRTEAYLKSFHTKAALDYVSSGAYKTVTEFQRYVQQIADDLHARGIEYDLMD